MKTFEWEAEVFAAGVWNGLAFKAEDLDEIASAFNSLSTYLQVPLKFGHNDEQPMTDGEPALGWVHSLRVDHSSRPAKLIAKFGDVPELVYNAIKAKRYRSPSIELLFDVKHKGTTYPYVMTGVALLGADLPAVNVLSDLSAYMSSDRLAYSGTSDPVLTGGRVATFTYQLNEESNVDIEELKRKLAEQERVNADLQAKFTATQTEAERLKQEAVNFAAQQKAEKIRKSRGDVTSLLEAAVTEKRILPAQREALFKLLKVDDDDAVVNIEIDTVKSLIESNASKDFSADGGRNGRDDDGQITGRDASAELVKRANKFIADSGGKADFATAVMTVMKAEPELAEEHVWSNGVVRI